MKRLLFVTTRLFWPTDSGRKVSLYHYCRSLHYDYGYEIHLFSFLESNQEFVPGEKPEFIASVEVAEPVAPHEVAANLVRHSFGKAPWPLQCCLFFSGKNARRLREKALDLCPEVIVVDMIRTAQYRPCFDGLSSRLILDMDDLLSKRYENKLRVNDVENLMGAFGGGRLAHRHLGLLNVARRAALSIERDRVLRAEEEFSRQFDDVIFVSQTETDLFNKMTGTKKAKTVTMGVDYAYYSQEVEPAAGCTDVAFLGNMKYGPNVDALRFIVSEVLARIHPAPTLTVVGSVPESVISEFSINQGVRFTGRVEDVRPHITGAKVFLAPITSGSGIKTKILEAMAMGAPVVTNSVGAEGLMAVRGRDIVVEDNPSDLAVAVKELLDDPARRMALSANGREYVRGHHVWSDVLSAFGDMGL